MATVWKARIFCNYHNDNNNFVKHRKQKQMIKWRKCWKIEGYRFLFEKQDSMWELPPSHTNVCKCYNLKMNRLNPVFILMFYDLHMPSLFMTSVSLTRTFRLSSSKQWRQQQSPYSKASSCCYLHKHVEDLATVLTTRLCVWCVQNIRSWNTERCNSFGSTDHPNNHIRHAVLRLKEQVCEKIFVLHFAHFPSS